MCEKCGQSHSQTYNEFPARIVGGPTGFYFLHCDVKSSEYTEFRVLSVATGDVAGSSTIIVSGREQPFLVPFDGSISLTDTTVADGLIYHISPTISLPIVPTWIRVVNPQKRVFVAINTQASNSVYLSIQFRDKIIKTIPGPFVTVHPSDMEQYNEERSRRIKLSVLGEEGELEEYGNRPGKPARIKR